ncbi:putative general amidase [Talaromyces proteolyticus]|uniref:amidase n=1 Tax=Talaromyces proteolyticus TaxID=1131652 RepID=A0AAD4Q1W1_9EURO|nr:putative general amidase [Talaromyces proteolyticus]KAH8698925.1 putative general amidase [Talaromyces proteolyticus]
MGEPAYLDISARKWKQLNSLIPAQWRLDDKYIPRGMRLSPIESVHKLDGFGDDMGSLVDIPRKCGILNSREIAITENWDVQGLLYEIAEKRLTSEEVALAFCKRAAVAQQLTRCLTEPLFTEALEQARRLDHHLKRTGKLFGPLHGLPVTVKDTFDVKGVDSTVGITALAFKPAIQDAALVELLRSLGAIIIAKTNVPQTMSFLDSVNNIFGRTLNPLNRSLTAGGSSGGEGVAVAMRASMVGFGTDIGGSIRIPAMCNGIYGFKPSVGRIPYGGTTSGQPNGKLRVALKPVAGPIARSIEDIDAIMKELVPRSELFGHDCIPGLWPSLTPLKKKLRIGLLLNDGLVNPVPPITNILKEVSNIIARSQVADIEVVDISAPAVMKKCMFTGGRLMDVDGSGPLLDLLDQTGEPLMPYLRGRTKRRPPMSIEKLYALCAERDQIEVDMRQQMWSWPPSTATTSKVFAQTLDAVICPVAAHPVPKHDSYGSLSYTTTFVLLDYPTGTIPVRNMTETDLNLEFNAGDKPLSKFDEGNRQFWKEDRKIYLGSPLSVQVVTPRLHDHELCQVMSVIDSTLKRHYQSNTKAML